MGIDAIKHGNKHITATRKHKHGQAPQTWMESCQVRGFGSPQFLKDQHGSTGLHFPLPPLPGLANCQQGQSYGSGSWFQPAEENHSFLVSFFILILTGGAQPHVCCDQKIACKYVYTHTHTHT